MAEVFADLAAEIVAELDNEFESNLVSAVKLFPCLYATDHVYYHNMQQNKIAWQKISNSLGKSVTECMNKWYGLLQTFMSHSKLECNNERTIAAVSWPHYESFKEIQPYLTEDYSDVIQLKPTVQYSEPSSAQKDKLLNELECCRFQLVVGNSYFGRRSQIWEQIAKRLNEVPAGVKMPVLNWQKYWWDLKMNVRIQRRNIGSKLPAARTQNQLCVYTDDDLRIMKICGAKPMDSPSDIYAHLSSNIEFGMDKDIIVRKCKKCAIILHDRMIHDYCETCRKIPKTLCDICSETHEQGLFVYKVKNWSTHGKNLLPSSLNSYNELSICSICSNGLKKQAGVTWIACRICENSNPNNQALDYLFDSSIENLRKIFKEATNITFSELDGLPNYICKVCKVQMQQFNNFYLRFSRAQTRLRQIQLIRFVGEPINNVTNKCGKGNDNAITTANKVIILNPEGKTLTVVGSKNSLKSRLNSEYPTIASIGATTSQTPSMPVWSKCKQSKPFAVNVCVPPKPVSSSTVSTVNLTTQPGPALTATKPVKANYVIQPGPASIAAGPSKSNCTLQAGPGSLTPSVQKRVFSSTAAKGIFRRGLGPASGSPNCLNARQTSGNGMRAIPTGSAVATKVAATVTITKDQRASLLTSSTVSSMPPIKIPSTVQVQRSSTTPTFGNIRPSSGKVIYTPHQGSVQRFPINASSQQGSVQTFSIPTSTAVARGNCASPKGPKPQSPLDFNSGATGDKRLQTSHPFVFTIKGKDLDFKRQLNKPQNRLSPSLMTSYGQPIHSSSVNPTMPSTADITSTAILQTIKTEVIDVDYPEKKLKTSSSYNAVQPNTSCQLTASDISSNTSTISVKSTNLDSNEKNPKEIPDGSTVIVRPNQQLSFGNRTQPDSATRKAFTGKSNLILPKKVTKRNLEQSTVVRFCPEQKSKAYPFITEVQQLQAQQKTQQLLIAAGIKRLRRQCGAVINSQMTDNTNLHSKPLLDHRMAADNTTVRSTVTPETTSTMNKTLPVGGCPADVVIKKERLDEGDEPSVSNLQPADSDLNPSMFYPDSFELGNVSLEADMSSILQNMMIDPEVIGEEGFKYINPSFLLTYANDGNLSKNNECASEPEPNKNNEKNKNMTKENASDDGKFNIKLPMKKLRVKLRRSKELGKSTSRVKKTSPLPRELIAVRKSLRRSKAPKHKNL